MRALITGGNGFLGGALIRRLSSEDWHLRALVRDASARPPALPVTVEVVDGDITRPASLERALENVETVFHLAGLRRAAAPGPFREVNAEGTRNVCEAMVKAGARRLVLASSLAVHGPSRAGVPHVETDPYAPTEWYGESKVEAERIALQYAGRLEVVLLRPPRIMGPGDRENLPFFRIVQRGLQLKLAGPPRRLSLVDVDDCAEAFVLAAKSDRAPGEAFLLPGPEDTSLEELQRIAAQALGRRVRTLPVPETLLRGLATVADGVSKVTRRPLALSRKQAAQLLAPGWTCLNGKARRLLGWAPRHAPTESIARTARWYRDHRWI